MRRRDISDMMLDMHSKLRQRKLESILHRYIYVYVFDRSLFIFVRSRYSPSTLCWIHIHRGYLSVDSIEPPALFRNIHFPRNATYANVQEDVCICKLNCVNLLQTKRVIARNSTLFGLHLNKNTLYKIYRLNTIKASDRSLQLY